MLLLCVSLDVSDAHRYSWALPVALCNSAKCSFPAVAFPKIFVLCFCFSRARRGRRQRMQVGQCPSSVTALKSVLAGLEFMRDLIPALPKSRLSFLVGLTKIQSGLGPHSRCYKHGCAFHRWEPCSILAPHWSTFYGEFKSKAVCLPLGGAAAGQVCRSSGVASPLPVTAWQPRSTAIAEMSPWDFFLLRNDSEIS